jgi:hypothetical protein
MDAFEQLVAEILSADGFWVQTSVKVRLTKDEKVRIGRHSSPRWELDVVAYKASINELWALECKSFLDSTGVQLAELQDGHSSKLYKLFREPVLRETVLTRLALQFVEEGRCRPDPVVKLGMVAGKVKRGQDEMILRHFAERKWEFFGPQWMHDRLERAAQDGYDNKVSSVVAKLLLRTAIKSVARPKPV